MINHHATITEKYPIGYIRKQVYKETKRTIFGRKIE
jgi:hypothetical protein